MIKQRMKFPFAVLVMIVLVLGQSYAQRGQQMNGERPSPEERAAKMTEKMTEKLGLNDYQSDQIAALNTDLAASLGSLKDSDLTRDEKKEAAKSLRDTYNSNVSGILDADQYQKFQKWQEKKMDRRKGQRGGKGKRGGQCQGHGNDTSLERG